MQSSCRNDHILVFRSSKKKPKVSEYDPDDKVAAKEQKQREAAEARERKKALAAEEKERKKLARYAHMLINITWYKYEWHCMASGNGHCCASLGAAEMRQAAISEQLVYCLLKECIPLNV